MKGKHSKHLKRTLLTTRSAPLYPWKSLVFLKQSWPRNTETNAWSQSAILHSSIYAAKVKGSEDTDMSMGMRSCWTMSSNMFVAWSEIWMKTNNTISTSWSMSWINELINELDTSKAKTDFSSWKNKIKIYVRIGPDIKLVNQKLGARPRMALHKLKCWPHQFQFKAISNFLSAPSPNHMPKLKFWHHQFGNSNTNLTI